MSGGVPSRQNLADALRGARRWRDLCNVWRKNAIDERAKLEALEAEVKRLAYSYAQAAQDASSHERATARLKTILKAAPHGEDCHITISHHPETGLCYWGENDGPCPGCDCFKAAVAKRGAR